MLDSIRPRGSLVSGKVSLDQERYFALKELADAIVDTLNGYENRLEDNKNAKLEGRQPEATGRKMRIRAFKVKQLRYDHHNTQPFKSLTSAESMEEAIRDLFETAEPLPDDDDLFEMENRLALLRLMATAPQDVRPVYLRIRGFPEGIDCSPAEALAGYYLDGWKDGLGIKQRDEA